eukprot:c23552_g1_i1 orf=375-2036(-)
MTNARPSKPPGLKLLSKLLPNTGKYSFEVCKGSILLLTFVAYALYHASRKPPSIVKNALISHDNLSLPNDTVAPFTWPLNMVFIRKPLIHDLGLSKHPAQKGWPPFDGKQGPALLGEVDLAFLASYAVSMFLAGHMGDRFCLRMLLSIGMVGSGISVALFGCAYWWNVHWLGYFFLVQVVGGVFQATGWPSVVTIVSNWFGKSKRGLIMGVWNAHTSVGNICGTLMASEMLRYGWGWSFLVPGVAIAVGGAIIYLFLLTDPEVAGFPSPYEYPQTRLQDLDEEEGFLNVHDEALADVAKSMDEDGMRQPLLEGELKGLDTLDEEVGNSAVGFLQAWSIPRVAPFAFCLFFTKLVAYTFLYWLPFYIRHTEIEGEYLSDVTAGNLSIIFDVGGTVGGILAGHLSDRLNARAMVAAFFTYASLPVLLLYRVYGSESLWLNLVLLFLAGVVVNGPYALITTAVSADLGTHESLKGNSRSLATVTAIIDGMGSVGAAIGPLLTGYLSKAGWNSVFGMLGVSATIAGLLLTGLVIEESRDYATNVKLARLKVRQIDLV